jgi:two-component system, chemotaxis family, protein-glutamate methylesterase/glutaminase
MKQYRVLVVDDSAFMRRAVSHMLELDPQFIVSGIARNGVEAVEKVKRLKPDLVTMDVEMPEMNGLKALELIMKTFPVLVVMLSNRTGEGARETLEALELGAVDFFLKDNLLSNQQGSDQSTEFLSRLKGIVEAKLPSQLPKKNMQVNNKSLRKKKNIELIFIGCSTGGPSALQKILPFFSEDFPIPIVVAQHMPPGFTKALAERFNTLCKLIVKEAQNGELVEAGTIYIAPSGYQTRFIKNQDGIVAFNVEKRVEEQQALYKPSIDISLCSAAPIYTDKLLSVILTGMGVDGMVGCSVVKKYQGSVFVEAEDSCVVYGMPKAVLEAGYADQQFELSHIYQEIVANI